MAGRNFYEKVWDFLGNEVFTTTQADNAPFRIADTSAAGTPTYALNTPTGAGSCGELAVAFDNTNEVQNVCVYQSDILQFIASKIIEIEFRLKMNQATPNAATSFAFGLASARNDAIASITNRCMFRLVGASQVLGVETADGTTTNSNVATPKLLSNAYKDCLISFANGLGDVRFFVDGEPALATGVSAISLAALSATAALQVFMQIQKTANAETDGFTVDRIRIAGRR